LAGVTFAPHSVSMRFSAGFQSSANSADAPNTSAKKQFLGWTMAENGSTIRTWLARGQGLLALFFAVPAIE
jgi:hypothetical protein